MLTHSIPVECTVKSESRQVRGSLRSISAYKWRSLGQLRADNDDYCSLRTGWRGVSTWTVEEFCWAKPRSRTIVDGDSWLVIRDGVSFRLEKGVVLFGGVYLTVLEQSR